MKKAYIIIPVLLILFFIGFGIFDIDADAQCAMCKAQLESSDKAGIGAKNTGINSGILYLMLCPYLLIALIAFLWYRSSNKNKEHVSAN